MNKTIFYGSLYADEMKDYREMIEIQFHDCAEKAKEKNLEVMAWGFDVLVEDETNKKIAEDFAEQCAKHYFPNVPGIANVLEKGKK